MTEIIAASHDVVFKALFVRNPDILRAFLRDVLDLPITDEDKLTILNPELIPISADGKLSRLDIHVETPGRRFNIEMQARSSGFDAERILYYWAKMYSDDFESGGKYEDLEQTYSVNILDFRYLDGPEYHSSFSVREDKRHDRLTDKLAIHIFELPKVPREFMDGDDKQMWMELIKANSMEALDMVQTSTQNPAIQKATQAVRTLNADAMLREQIRQRDKAIRDYDNDMAIARSEGLARGRSEGLARGRAEGLAQGRAEGVSEAHQAIARKMRENGYTDEQIKLILGSFT